MLVPSANIYSLMLSPLDDNYLNFIIGTLYRKMMPEGKFLKYFNEELYKNFVRVEHRFENVLN